MNTSNNPDRPTLDRRNLLRGGVAAATVAGLGVAAVAGAPAAAAADGDPVELGTANAETTSTSITINGTTGDADNAPLSLTNSNGPALKLNTLADDWRGELQAGEFATVESGPIVGLADGSTTFLATGVDLQMIPLTLPLSPIRLVDLRTAAGRQAVIGSSPKAFDPQGRLNGGAWMDITLGDSGGPLSIGGIYANVTVTGSSSGGYLTVYPPDGSSRPTASNLNWAAGQTIANLVFAAVGDNNSGASVIRVYSSAATFVILDINGVVALFNPNEPTAIRSRTSARGLGSLTQQATRKLTAASTGR